MNRKKNLNYFIEVIVVFIILSFLEYFFFRNVIFTNTGALLGDRGDGRLTTLLAEHWYNFFRGREKFSEIAMFYPINGVIGYTDLLFGYGVLHSFLRTLGLNMFVAYKWTIVLTCLMGTYSMYYLLRKTLKVQIFWSLFGTIGFCFSDTFARHLGHTQLGAICNLSLLLILLIGFIRNISSRKKRNIYAYTFLSVFILLAYNSWYIACFTGIFLLFFFVIYYLLLAYWRKPVFSLIKESLEIIRKDIIGYLAYAGLLFIPFLQIYIPVLQATSGYSYKDCTLYMPEIADIINVTETNFLLGNLMEKLELSSRGYSGEVTMGYSIILLSLFVFTFFKHKQKVLSDSKAREKLDNKNIILLSFFAVIIFTQFSIVRLSANGISLWMIIYKILPFAKSIRAIARFMLWLSFPMSVITSYAADKYIPCNKLRNNLIALILVLLIFVSNINKIGVNQNWNKPDEWNFITNVAAPPDDLQSFYIIDTSENCDIPVNYQLDAFEIATWYSLKTINGYSGKFPPDWWGIWDLCNESYLQNVSNWIETYDLKNVYAYDKARNEWIPYE